MKFSKGDWGIFSTKNAYGSTICNQCRGRVPEEESMLDHARDALQSRCETRGVRNGAEMAVHNLILLIRDERFAGSLLIHAQ